MTVREFQKQIERIYLEKDRGRGWQETFVWFVEEVGEMGRTLRARSLPEMEAEFADVFAWLSTLASIVGVDLEAVAQAKYGGGCPKCGRTPCACVEKRGREQA